MHCLALDTEIVTVLFIGSIMMLIVTRTKFISTFDCRESKDSEFSQYINPPSSASIRRGEV